MLNLTEYRDPAAFRVGEMENRAYFIPFSNSLLCGSDRRNSAYYTDLCDGWEFSYYDTPTKLPEHFCLSNAALENISTVDLPECWQTRGFDYAQYQHSPYTFLYQPPAVPECNPCALYRKRVELSPEENVRYEFHIEGKASCVYLWVNGEKVGFGQVPHNESVFDVTPYLRQGENFFVMLVMKWCAGSYLDDQDMIRLNGIFREVYLLRRAPDGIRDFRINAGMDGVLHLHVDSEAPVFASLLDADGRLIVSGEGNTQCLSVPDVRLWSAEEPYCYRLVLFCAGEYISQYVGFRTVQIEDGVFYLNGKPIKLYGVNRHDSSLEHGYAVTREEMECDLRMMKKYNINAIRSSHYPNSPLFYELCDRYGFYVMCEADVESHGCAHVNEWGRIMCDPLYHDAVLDRVGRMHDCYCNFSSIVIWSLGNESSWGPNLRDAAAWLKAQDRTRPVHYEGIFKASGVVREGDDAYEFRLIDFRSGMYTAVESLERILNKATEPKRPIIMCEYSHSMGNSGGDLRQYMDLFDSNERYLGGYVWEWCDHAMYCTDENGVRYLGYGGDFPSPHGDHWNGGNFCIDGLVSPNRVPHTALLELKEAYAPLRFEAYDRKHITIRNRRYFKDLSDLELRYTLESEGICVMSDVLNVNVPPQESLTVELPQLPLLKGNCYMTFTAHRKQATSWAECGEEACMTQFEVQRVAPTLPTPHPAGKLTVESHGDCISVIGNGFVYRFSRSSGMLQQMEKNGKPLLVRPLSLCCWRAPVDNDKPCFGLDYAHEWERNSVYGYIRYPESNVTGLTLTSDPTEVTVDGKVILGGQGRFPVFSGTLRYHISEVGAITLSLQGEVAEKLPFWLPRLGWLMELLPDVSHVRYYGLGARENYADKNHYSRMGWYEGSPEELTEHYEKPQTNGVHTKVRHLELLGDGISLCAVGEDFTFSVSRYSDGQLADTAHDYQLRPEDAVFLHLDAAMSGVGSTSCGANQLPPEYCIGAGSKIDFSITLG